MAAIRKPSDPMEPRRRSRPGTTPEARERQLVALAFDLAEKQLADGTASAQVTTHFLKLGSEREKLERQKLKYETQLLETRKNQIESGARIEELYTDAIAAMREYGGHSPAGDSHV